MILRNPLTSPVRGARQNGRAPSRAFGRAQKAIYAGSIRIPQDAGYRGYAEDIQLEQQLIRKLLYSPTGLSTFFLEFVQNWFAFSKKPSVLIFGYVQYVIFTVAQLFVTLRVQNVYVFFCVLSIHMPCVTRTVRGYSCNL